MNLPVDLAFGEVVLQKCSQLFWGNKPAILALPYCHQTDVQHSKELHNEKSLL